MEQKEFKCKFMCKYTLARRRKRTGDNFLLNS